MTNDITPASIDTIKFQIPLYQRPYDWEQEQVQKLLDDLNQAYEKNKEPPYYIGIMSIAPTINDANRYDLIDGQQRITTLMLIGKIAKQYYNEWSKFLNDRLCLYARPLDQKYLSNDDENVKCNPNMKNAINIIEDFFDTKIKDKYEFSKYIFEKTSFFLSEIPEGYSILDKNQQFVRMNNRGKQLESYEILKIKLASKFEDITDIEKKKEKKSSFNETWDKISQLGCSSQNLETKVESKKTLSDLLNTDSKTQSPMKESEILYEAILTFPDFLLIGLSRFLEKDKENNISYDTDKLLETFGFGNEPKIEWDSCKVDKFIFHLKNQYEIYDKYFIKRDKIGEEYKFKVYTTDEILSFKDFSDKNMSHLKILQSYMYVSRQPKDWLKDAFDWFSQNNTFEIDDFCKKLEAIDSEYAKSRTPKTEENLEVGCGTPHYYFYRFDYLLYKWMKQENQKDIFSTSLSDKQKNLFKNFRFRKCKSVEHIIPQNQEGANLPVNDKFENLALLSRGVNSKLNNNPPDGKKTILETCGYCESLKMLFNLYCNGIKFDYLNSFKNGKITL